MKESKCHIRQVTSGRIGGRILRVTHYFFFPGKNPTYKNHLNKNQGRGVERQKQANRKYMRVKIISATVLVIDVLNYGEINDVCFYSSGDKFDH